MTYRLSVIQVSATRFAQQGVCHSHTRVEGYAAAKKVGRDARASKLVLLAKNL